MIKEKVKYAIGPALILVGIGICVVKGNYITILPLGMSFVFVVYILWKDYQKVVKEKKLETGK